MFKKRIFFSGLAVACIMASCSTSHYTVKNVSRTRDLIDARYDVNPDARAAKVIAPYQKQVDSIMGPVVAVAAKYMVAHQPESELSNLLADIMVWAGKNYNEKPDFGVYNMGGIRAGIAQGNITYGDVLDVAPFENKICFLTLTGEQTMQLFQQIAHLGGEAVSSSVRMTMTKDGKLLDVTVDGKPVEASRSYRIATLDYLAQGNDHLTAFKNGTNLLAPSEDKNNSRFVILEYFKEQTAQGKLIDPKIEGRIVVKAE